MPAQSCYRLATRSPGWLSPSTHARPVWRPKPPARPPTPRRPAVASQRHPMTMLVTTNLANVYAKDGKKADAEKLYREALQTKIETLGAHHESTLKSMNNLSAFLIEQKKFIDAAPMMERRSRLHCLHGHLPQGHDHDRPQLQPGALRLPAARRRAAAGGRDARAGGGGARKDDRDTKGLAATYAQLLTAAGQTDKVASVKAEYAL